MKTSVQMLVTVTLLVIATADLALGQGGAGGTVIGVTDCPGGDRVLWSATQGIFAETGELAIAGADGGIIPFFEHTAPGGDGGVVWGLQRDKSENEIVQLLPDNETRDAPSAILAWLLAPFLYEQDNVAGLTDNGAGSNQNIEQFQAELPDGCSLVGSVIAGPEQDRAIAWLHWFKDGRLLATQEEIEVLWMKLEVADVSTAHLLFPPEVFERSEQTPVVVINGLGFCLQTDSQRVEAADLQPADGVTPTLLMSGQDPPFHGTPYRIPFTSCTLIHTYIIGPKSCFRLCCRKAGGAWDCGNEFCITIANDK